MNYFRFRNFRQFERNRREIRLPYTLLNDSRFKALPDGSKAHVLLLLLQAARSRNRLPCDEVMLSGSIGATEPIQLELLSQFIEALPEQNPAPSAADRRASRYVPDELRMAVLMRDGARCLRCRRSDELTIDHITPISRGGETVESNLQTLCRNCNRRKSNRHSARL
jgi:5-methylcytosine-specific restriction endonuclease McrA